MSLNINKIPGRKYRKSYYKDLISPHIPNDLHKYTYVEPFAGSFMISTFLNDTPKSLVYNDINIYDGIDQITSDIIEHIDFEECINKWDSVNTIFYIDPPYYGKEDLYKGCVKNDKDFHVRLRNVLKNIKGKFILNYEKCDFIEILYEDFTIYYYEGNIPFIKDITITNDGK